MPLDHCTSSTVSTALSCRALIDWTQWQNMWNLDLVYMSSTFIYAVIDRLLQGSAVHKPCSCGVLVIYALGANFCGTFAKMTKISLHSVCPFLRCTVAAAAAAAVVVVIIVLIVLMVLVLIVLDIVVTAIADAAAVYMYKDD